MKLTAEFENKTLVAIVCMALFILIIGLIRCNTSDEATQGDLRLVEMENGDFVIQEFYAQGFYRWDDKLPTDSQNFTFSSKEKACEVLKELHESLEMERKSKTVNKIIPTDECLAIINERN